MNFQGLSSHADRNHLLSWIQAIQAPKPQHVFVVHGDREVAPFFAKTIQGLGFTAHAPQYTEVYDLIADKVTEPGYLPERKARTTGGMRASAAYERLVAVGNMLMESIKRSRGRDNKSLARFAGPAAAAAGEVGELRQLPCQREGGLERGLQLHAVELRRRILVFFDGVPVVVRKQVPEPQGQAAVRRETSRYSGEGR